MVAMVLLLLHEPANCLHCGNRYECAFLVLLEGEPLGGVCLRCLPTVATWLRCDPPIGPDVTA